MISHKENQISKFTEKKEAYIEAIVNIESKIKESA